MPITGKDVRRQLKADLIGKDSYRGVTLTYSWLANQFGHISLGLIPTLILLISITNCPSKIISIERAPYIICIIWGVFETYNFLGPLLLKTRTDSKILFIPGKSYIFQPAWGNVAFDTGTDLLFFFFGAFLASVLYHYSTTHLIILLTIAVVLIYPVSIWFPTKMYLQIPQYPFQFRLSQWDIEEITSDDINTIKRFLKNKNDGLHLFIFGAKNTGKTSMSVGISTELSIRHKDCVYTTAMKLYSMFFDSEEVPESLWNWRTASVLVIDDINPGDPIKADITSPYHFLRYLDMYTVCNYRNRAAIKQKNIIWVLGNDDPKRQMLDKWQEMLEIIGVDRSNILSVNLPGVQTADTILR